MKRKILSIFTAVVLTTLSLSNDISVEAREVYGITYDETSYTANFNTGKYMYTYGAEGVTIGKMWYNVGKLRNKIKNPNGTYQDVAVVRMQMEPLKNVKTKLRGTIYGVSEYLAVSIGLPSSSINDWSPKNEPKTSTWDIGLSIGGDKSGLNGAITASTEITKSQLEYEADIQISNRKAKFIFDYKPEKRFMSYSTTANKYTRNTSMQYAMVSYNSAEYKNLSFDFEANFTYAYDEDAKPTNVVFGSYEGEKTFIFSFK